MSYRAASLALAWLPSLGRAWMVGRVWGGRPEAGLRVLTGRCPIANRASLRSALSLRRGARIDNRHGAAVLFFVAASGNDRYLRTPDGWSRRILLKTRIWPRSQFRRPLAASMEISLAARLSDRLCYVRLSRRPCCDNDWRRQHYARGCGIFAVPQFPSFSTIST